jgi:imidazolonepropionase-like amidohydrolase
VALDGKGRVMHNTRIAIEGSKIAAIDPKAGPVDYDLRGLTVLPGWIDAHVQLPGASAKMGKMRAWEEQPRKPRIKRPRMPG